MIAKKVFRSVLLIVVLGSVAIWANREYQQSQALATVAATAPPAESLPVVAGNQVVMTYFISGPRCVSCKTIEALARETAEERFAAQLASQQVVFRVIDTGVPAHHHYVNDYQLTSKTVILSHRVDGRETEWVNLPKVWDLLEEPEDFSDYLAVAIHKYLAP